MKGVSNNDITIFWDKTKCIHAAECVKNQPSVFKPQQRRWINPENATTEEIIATINKCPTGALSYQSKIES